MAASEKQAENKRVFGVYGVDNADSTAVTQARDKTHQKKQKTQSKKSESKSNEDEKEWTIHDHNAYHVDLFNDDPSKIDWSVKPAMESKEEKKDEQVQVDDANEIIQTMNPRKIPGYPPNRKMTSITRVTGMEGLKALGEDKGSRFVKKEFYAGLYHVIPQLPHTRHKDGEMRKYLGKMIDPHSQYLAQDDPRMKACLRDPDGGLTCLNVDFKKMKASRGIANGRVFSSLSFYLAQDAMPKQKDEDPPVNMHDPHETSIVGVMYKDFGEFYGWFANLMNKSKTFFNSASKERVRIYIRTNNTIGSSNWHLIHFHTKHSPNQENEKN